MESASDPKPQGRLQLDYIDGLRALLALYIAAHHAMIVDVLRSGPPSTLQRFFEHGQEVVAMFLAVSGFCLALPHAQKGKWSVDSLRFFRRRALRILPPYYAAVVLAILFGLVKAHYGYPLTLKSIWVHGLMFQNWSATEMFTLDGPLWSVALEVQVYLLFPLVIASRRKLGPFATLALWSCVGLISMHLLHGKGQTVFLMFFAIGFFFAEVAFRPAWHWALPWCIALAAGLMVFASFFRTTVADGMGAVFTGALLAYLVPRHGNLIRRWLSSKPLVFIGLFSYSIYLIHSLFTETAFSIFVTKDPTFANHLDMKHNVVMFGAALISLPVAYVFHRCFELPFMSVKRQQVEARLS